MVAERAIEDGVEGGLDFIGFVPLVLSDGGIDEDGGQTERLLRRRVVQVEPAQQRLGQGSALLRVQGRGVFEHGC